MHRFPVEAVEKTIGYTFKSKELLIQVFRMANGQGNAEERWRDTNAPLAYLGDPLIEFLLAEHLIINGEVKGSVVKICEYVRKTPILAGFFQELNIIELLHDAGFPFKLQNDGVRDRGELFEALTAAIYRDGGLEPVKNWMRRTVFRQIHKHTKMADRTNPIMLIQHYCQKQYNCLPEFRIIASPAGKRQNTFTVELRAAGLKLGVGDETSIKAARNAAAKQACGSLKLFER